MSRPPVSKMIGLIRNLTGSYSPVNFKSAVRLEEVFKRYDLLLFGQGISRRDLPALKVCASKLGYHIVTTNKMVRQ